MEFDVSTEETKKAVVPHELFLTNVIGNHILMFVSLLGLASSWPAWMLVVPVVSVSILGYTLWRASRAERQETWYVHCHWQVAAKRSRIFISMLLFLAVVLGFGLLGHYQWGWMVEAVYALVGGAGLLPTMVVMLVLIIMESDALHQARHGKLPESVVKRYPRSLSGLGES